jgi:hypothetical protein
MAGFIQVYILSVYVLLLWYCIQEYHYVLLLWYCIQEYHYVLLLWYCIQEYHARMVHLFSISLKSGFLGRDYLVVRFTSTCSTNDYKHKH